MSRLAVNSLAIIAACSAFVEIAGAATPQPPHPLGSPGNWVNSEDYPPGPLRREEEGIVGFTLTIRPDGTVGGCEVTKSSGSDDLDQAACTLITERARFEAAIDDRGHHVAGTWSNSVRWQIPKDEPPPQPMVMVMSMLVDKDGNVSDCRIERVEGPSAAALKVGPAPQCFMDSVSGPYLDKNGNPVARRVRMTHMIEVLPEEPVPTLPSAKSKP